MSDKILKVLLYKKFIGLFISQLISCFADNFIRTAFITLFTFYYYTFDVAVPSNQMVMFALAVFILPFCLFSTLGGELGDAFDKAKVIQWIKFINLFIALFLVFATIIASYWFMLIGLFLLGVQSAMFGACKYSMIPSIFSGEKLIFANALIEGSTFLGILIGTMLGGAISAESSFHMFICCIVILGSAAISYLFALIIPSTQKAAKIKINYNFISSTVQCIKHVLSYRDLVLIIIGISWFWLSSSIFSAQIVPIITRETFKGNESVFILLLGVFSVGIGFGSFVISKILRDPSHIHLVPISILMMCLFLLDLWYTVDHCSITAKNLKGIHYFLSQPDGLRATIDFFSIAMFAGMYIVPLYSYLQVHAPKQYRTRILAANNAINAFFIVIASLTTTLLLFFNFSTSHLLLFLVISNFIATFFICCLLPDAIVRNLFRLLISIICKVEVKGLENYEKAGKNVLIIANHVSFLDPFLIGIFIPDRLVFAIDTHIAKSLWIRPFLRFLRAHPVDPNNPMAMKTLIDKLKSNKPVVIFPEGRITVTGSLMKIYEGPGLVADMAGASLLPIRMEGAEFSLFSRMNGKAPISWKPKITMTIMPHRKIDTSNMQDENYSSRKRRHEIGNQLYRIMSDMMFNKAESQLNILSSVIEAKRLFGGRHMIAQDVNKVNLNYNRLLMGMLVLGNKIENITSDEEKLGILLPNACATIVTFIAMMAYNRVPAMLNFGTGSANVIAACKVAGIRQVYTSRVFIEKANLDELIIILKKNEIDIVYLEDLRAKIKITDKLMGFFNLIRIRSWYRKRLRRINKKHNPMDLPACVLFTSGSEGVPKGVVLSHRNIICNLQQLSSRIDFTSADIVFNALPMFHSFGLTAATILPLVSGVQVILYPSPLHYRIIPEIIYGSNATILFGTDTFLSGYAKYAHPYDFFSIRYVFAGAEKLKEETMRLWMDRFGRRIFEGYGATETSPAISVNTPMYYKAGSVGQILPNMEYKIVPVKGIENGGKLVVSGPNIMMGYLKPDGSGKITAPGTEIDGKKYTGWYDTGDVVEIDKDGYIKIIGRVKRFVKIGGEMISMGAVEEVVCKLWPEHLHAIMNKSDEQKGEIMVLYTTYRDASRDLIVAFFKQNGYNELMIPKAVIILEEMPLLATGKIDYVTLKTIVGD